MRRGRCRQAVVVCGMVGNAGQIEAESRQCKGRNEVEHGGMRICGRDTACCIIGTVTCTWGYTGMYGYRADYGIVPGGYAVGKVVVLRLSHNVGLRFRML